MDILIEQTIVNFLSETESLIENVSELPYSTAAELYDVLDIKVKLVTSNIKSFNTELRTEICVRQDKVLERIVDEGAFSRKIFEKSLSVYTPAIHDYRRWTNTELLTDKCLTGYMLAKTFDMQPVMYYGTRPSDYPYLNVLPGLCVLYHNSPSGTADAYYEHLKNEYKQMDILILHGMYEQTIEFLDVYRKFRPDGKVYCGLDMCSNWMSIIDWKHPRIHKFLEQCDIVATSCTSLRDALNRNQDTNFSCRWLTNGFFKASDTVVKADPDLKENIILTVGRIGTVQKNNAELLFAFAKISEIIQGWTLRLVGPIETDFQPFINEYFSRHPHLKDRVTFTGSIECKDELYKEYERAKIFVLTSQYEGFPNVYAEALFHGCMFITSSIDAADDITGFGTLGIKYELGDIDALSSALVDLSCKSDKSAIQKHISIALKYARKYFEWNRNAKKLGYMLYRNQGCRSHWHTMPNMAYFHNNRHKTEVNK